MSYRIARDGQVFGPYTAEQIVRYLATGNVLPSDLAQAEGQPEWLPVSDLFPVAPARVPTPPSPGAPLRLYPDPPDLPWWVVLVLAIFTGALFAAVWDLVESGWLYRIDRTTRAFWIYTAVLVVFFVKMPGTWHDVNHNLFGGPLYVHPHGLSVGLVSLGLALWSRFQFREELLRHFNTIEPLGLELNPILTLFFGGIYFQYKFNRINEQKRALRVSVP